MSLVAQSRGVSRGTLECLGVVGSRCLGSSGSPLRLSDPFPVTTSSLSCSDSPSQLQPQFRQGPGVVRCGVRISGKGGHRDRTPFPRVLQSPLCHSQSHRGLATSHASMVGWSSPVFIWRLPQFIPGHLNVLADSLSRRSQVLGSEWTLCPQAFAELLRRWPATIDLLATAMTHRLLVYFSPMYDPMSAGTDAMLLSWDGLQAYAFPPFGLLPRVLAKVRASRNLELTLVAPFWPQHLWFPDLLELLLEVPLFLPKRRDLLRQSHFHLFHQQLSVLQLTAFRISGDPHVRPASLTRWLVNLPAVDAVPPASTTRPSG